LADELPESIVLQSLDLRGGRTVTINVTGPSDAGPKVSDFYDHLRRSQVNSKPLFDITKGNLPTYSTPQGIVATWRFDLELDRAENP
jgi:Tfp pilus assembly protein PilN